MKAKKSIFLTLSIVLLCVFAGCTPAKPIESPPSENIPESTNVSNPEGMNAVSPDKQKIAFTKWNPEILKAEIFVMDVSGTNQKKIAEQEAPEGSGGLVANSLSWATDNKNIIYSEQGVMCNIAYCKELADETLMKLTYQVNLETGKKTLLSKTPQS